MKAIVNKDKCFGCGGCVASMGKIFDFDDETGKVNVIADEIKNDDESIVKTAIEYCPTDAIEEK